MLYTSGEEHLSYRTNRFLEVVHQCLDHIESYTVPQYGDWPNDQLTKMTLPEIRHDMQRYINRMGSNSRGHEDSLRDMLKLMHYAAEAYLMLKGGDDEN